MTDSMKILIAYDGSDCAQAALDDLRSAGLPAKAEVKVVAVLETWFPPPSSWALLEGPSRASQELDTLALAQGAAVSLRSLFPGWELTAQEELGSPASVLLKIADDWQPDLLVIGSHGRSAAGRLFLGSVSQKVLHEARCSVRIARGSAEAADTPARLLIAMDGSRGAMAAVDGVVARQWPAESQARIVNATWSMPPITAGRMVAPITDWIAEENARIKTAMEAATAKLQGVGLITSSVVEEEEPKDLICKEAERWGADCIFIGARGMGPVERLMIGSISSGVAARAHCSVEVVRPAK